MTLVVMKWIIRRLDKLFMIIPKSNRDICIQPLISIFILIPLRVFNKVPYLILPYVYDGDHLHELGHLILHMGPHLS